MHPTSSAARRRHRFPLLAPLVVLGVLASVLATPPTAFQTAAYKPFCLVDTGIPEEAYTVEQFARTHNFAPPPGIRGKRLFADTGHKLPTLMRPFLEYDVFPSVPGHGRPAARIVLSDRIPYASWYSPDHYRSFLLMFPVGCIPNATTLPPRNVFGGGRT